MPLRQRQPGSVEEEMLLAAAAPSQQLRARQSCVVGEEGPWKLLLLTVSSELCPLSFLQVPTRLVEHRKRLDYRNTGTHYWQRWGFTAM